MSKKSSRVSGVARIAVIVGGTCAEMVRFVKSLGADAVLWVDVLTELEKINASPEVIRIVLAPGKTLASLFENLPDGEYAQRVRKLLESLPGVDLTSGLAQLAVAGIHAAEQLIRTPEFQAVLRQLYSKVRMLHNGTIERVDISLYSSLCGGCGGPAGGPLVEEIANYYRDHDHAVVNIAYFRAGALSYEGCGEAISVNAAAGVIRDIDFALFAPRSLAEVRSLNYFDFPMVGGDKGLRDRFMATAIQAFNCSEFRVLRDLKAPNVAANSRFGNITLFDLGWWHDLRAERIGRNVASRFRKQVLDVFGTGPALGVIDHIEVELVGQRPFADVSITQLIEQLRQHTRAQPAGLCDAAENVTCRFDSTIVRVVTPNLASGHFKDVWRERCAAPCRSMQEFRERLAFLRGLRLALDHEVQMRRDTLDRLRTQQREAKAVLVAVIDEYYPRAPQARVANWLFTDSRRRDRDRRFAFHVKALREAKLAVDRLEAETGALGVCRDDIEREIALLEQRLRTVLSLLDRRLPRQDAASQPDCVEISDIDKALRELLQIADSAETDEGRLTDVLLGAATRVTMHGLAIITGVNEAVWGQDPRVELIAHRLKDGPVTPGPFWGGKRPLSYDHTVVVLPPVADDLREQLENAFGRLMSSADSTQLLFADTAAAGFNVVQLKMRTPKSETDIMTPPIDHEWDKIAINPERYLPEGFDLDRHKPGRNGQSRREPASVLPR
ncbi:MAG: hypothetical protein ACKO38_01600 [Planctomycetota bacterium]